MTEDRNPWWHYFECYVSELVLIVGLTLLIGGGLGVLWVFVSAAILAMVRYAFVRRSIYATLVTAEIDAQEKAYILRLRGFFWIPLLALVAAIWLWLGYTPDDGQRSLPAAVFVVSLALYVIGITRTCQMRSSSESRKRSFESARAGYAAESMRVRIASASRREP